MDLGDHYAETRARLLELGASLSDDDAATRLLTCPEWTVKDAFAHVTGVCADVLDGNVEGAATDPWTARQVAERADRALPEILDEWTRRGPDLDALLRQIGGIDGVKRIPIDQWTHEQDVRGTLGCPGGKDAPVVAWAVETMVPGFGDGWAEAGRAPARVVATTGEWMLGDGEPVATLRASDFELARILVGRRSRTQALASWEGDGEPFVDHLVAFSFSATDVLE
jgi:uncharacterized protein (TIGR03083 family)